MKEKIKTTGLQQGMYVAELDKPWLDSPFLFQGFLLEDEDTIQQLIDYCDYVYIDHEKSDDSSMSFGKKSADTTGTFKSLGNDIIKNKKYQIDVEDELPTAKEIRRKSKESTIRMFNDVRMGKSLDVQAVKETVNEIVESITRNPDAMMLLSTIKDKDEYSVVHAFNVSAMSVIFGRYLGMGKELLEELGMGAMLHDVGETRIPQEILNKKGLLTAAEQEMVQSHTKHGMDILSTTNGIPQSAIDIAYTHHERCNSSGYPRNLPSADIPLFAKIVAIIDVYDAVTTSRYHKHGISSTDALKTMYDWRDRLFDGELIEKFIQCLGIYPVGSVVELNSGEVGIVFSVPPENRLLPKILLVRDARKKPYMPPKIIQLAQFKEEDQSAKYEITKVLESNSYGIDLKKYLLRDLQVEQMAAKGSARS